MGVGDELACRNNQFGDLWMFTSLQLIQLFLLRGDPESIPSRVTRRRDAICLLQIQDCSRRSRDNRDRVWWAKFSKGHLEEAELFGCLRDAALWEPPLPQVALEIGGALQTHSSSSNQHYRDGCDFATHHPKVLALSGSCQKWSLS